MYNENIETERLILKILDESHAHTVLDFYKRNVDFLSKWEPIREPEFYTIEFQQQLLSDERKKIQVGNLFKVWMFKKEDTQYTNAIGSIALNEIVRGCFQSCFIGYKIDKDYKNNGYMTEAINKMVDYAFNCLYLHRVEANIIPRNLPSIKVVENNEFVNEGISKKYLKINGVWEDHVHMVRLNPMMD